jgi:hypothetical protein
MRTRETRVKRKHVYIPSPEGHLPGPVDANFLRLAINLPHPRQKRINYESLVTLQYININLITVGNLSNGIVFHRGMLILDELQGFLIVAVSKMYASSHEFYLE